jgi:disulfide reductase
MKQNLILMVMLVLVISLNAAGETPNTTDKIKWLTNLEDAMNEAKVTNRYIFVDFTGSDWCGWCFKLDEEVFEKEAFIDYAKDNLIMLKLDYPKSIKQTPEVKKYNNEMAMKYKIQGFPTILMLDKNGEEIAKTGYQSGGALNYVDHIEELLKGKK